MKIKSLLIFAILCTVHIKSNCQTKLVLDVGIEWNDGKLYERPYYVAVGVNHSISSIYLLGKLYITESINYSHPSYNYSSVNEKYFVTGYENGYNSSKGLQLGLGYKYSYFFAEAFGGIDFNSLGESTVYLKYEDIITKNTMNLSYRKSFNTAVFSNLGFKIGVEYPLFENIEIGVFINGVHLFTNDNFKIKEANGNPPFLNDEQITEINGNTKFNFINEILFYGVRISYQL